ncbi:P27 family phage terminase small subunit [Mesorhizobium sp. M0025]|uniref:P27 family phage terminase small subunit n=1 Tax=Mesorhizobium sp. M0025 TaxID=2956846 RepID=UPI00333E0771
MTHLRGVKPTLSHDRDPLTKAPLPPRYFSAFAKAEWVRVMPRLIDDRIITKADLGGVEDFCLARGLVREIDAVMRDDSGMIDLKLVRAQDKAMQTARQLAAEYGLSPTSRTRVGGREDDDDDTNPLDVR